MKTIIFLLISFSAFAQKLETSYLFIATQDNCKQYEVKWQMKSKRVVIVSPVVNLDMKIVKKKVGKYKSWIGKDGVNYYALTFVKFPDGSALMFVPVTETYWPKSETSYIIGNSPSICK